MVLQIAWKGKIHQRLVTSKAAQKKFSPRFSTSKKNSNNINLFTKNSLKTFQRRLNLINSKRQFLKHTYCISITIGFWHSKSKYLPADINCFYSSYTRVSCHPCPRSSFSSRNIFVGHMLSVWFKIVNVNNRLFIIKIGV